MGDAAWVAIGFVSAYGAMAGYLLALMVRRDRFDDDVHGEEEHR